MNLYKFLRLLISLTLMTSLLTAQEPSRPVPSSNPNLRKWKTGIQAGPMLYFGDLSTQLKTIALARPGISVFGQYHFNEHLSLRVSILKGSVQGDDRMGNLSAEFWRRSLSFRSPITEVSVTGRIFFLEEKRQVRPYFMMGLGLYRFNPKADLFQGDIDINNRYYFQENGTILNAAGQIIQKDQQYETTLSDWKTEGADNSFIRYKSKYNKTQFNIPFGLGIKFSLSPRLDLAFETGIRYLFTDYLDDVSSRYSSPELIQQNFPDPQQQELAAYISNPSGTTHHFRGNELSNDIYVFSSAGIEYRFGKIIIPKTLQFAPYAPDYKETWSFGFGGGLLFMHGDMRDHKIAPTVTSRSKPNRSDLQPGGSLYVSHYMSRIFGIKAEVISGSLVSVRQPEFTSTPVMDLSASLLLNITNSFPRFKPYARKVDLYAQAGMGRASVIGSVRDTENSQTTRYTGPTSYTVLPIGLGTRIHLTPNIDLDLNYVYRHVNSDLLDVTRSGSDRTTINTVKDGYSWLNISVAWVLLKAVDKNEDPFRGIKKKVFRQLNTDTDKDGVPDIMDQDPYTLPGVKVNPKGMPMDRDHDGVPDLYDSDPFTPPGLRVDAQGMPADTDQDGIPDYRDLEKDSPKGALVNFKGQTFSAQNEARDTEAEIEALKPMLSTWNFLMIYFDFDKSFVKNEYYEPLSQLALLMEKLPELQIKLIGHADIRGNKAYNLKLSERRAQAVISVLSETYNISADRFFIEAKGKENPHTQYVSQAAQGSNRRVEIRLMVNGKELTGN